MTCRGICTRHKSKKIPKTLRYSENEKRCQICDIFIKWNGLFCPCCGYRLRHNARIQKYKIKKYIE
jgi:predicted amidophosphoribosyltransferase